MCSELSSGRENGHRGTEGGPLHAGRAALYKLILSNSLSWKYVYFVVNEKGGGGFPGFFFSTTTFLIGEHQLSELTPLPLY